MVAPHSVIFTEFLQMVNIATYINTTVIIITEVFLRRKHSCGFIFAK